MTSPPVITSDAAIALAATENSDRPPNLELTAGEEGHARAQAVAKMELDDDLATGKILHTEKEDQPREDASAVVGEVRTEPAPDNFTESTPIPIQEQMAMTGDTQYIPPLPQQIEMSTQADYGQPLYTAPNDSLGPLMGMYNQSLPVGAGFHHPDLSQTANNIMDQDLSLQSTYEQDPKRISAYAKIIFDDGEFFMNTFQVYIGRDQQAAKRAQLREQHAQQLSIEAPPANGEPKTPATKVRERSTYSKSVVSESGFFREGHDPAVDEVREERRKRYKASKKSRSTGSSSNHPSRRNSLAQIESTSLVQQTELQPSDLQPQPRRYEAQTDGAAPVDPETLRPSPHDCPLVPIHPPESFPYSSYKSISRRHMKIAFNEEKSQFEATILGRNGAFIDTTFHCHKSVVTLHNGSILQVGCVTAKFLLPDVNFDAEPDMIGDYDDDPVSERYSHGGKEMSFDFDETRGDVQDTSADSSPQSARARLPRDEQEDEEEDEDQEREMEDDENEWEDQSDEEDDSQLVGQSIEPLKEELPKSQQKRGPGRPPKNGIMSKREEALAKKEAKEAALAQNQGKSKKTILQTQSGEPTKNKVGRPRKHPKRDTPPPNREKRKYTKRKPKEPKDGEAKGEGSGDDSSKEKKGKKPPKAPRSPTPVFNEAELTEEQLAKPTANYVILIHEAISSSPAGQMSLPQIYRAIQRKYPFFVCRTSTNGWQSSVRHNLSQNPAFTKVERDGKGWMWAIVEGAIIDKEKKRRVSPPTQSHSQMQPIPIYQAGHPPHMMNGQYHPSQGYQMGMPPHVQQGQHGQYMHPPPHLNGRPYPPGPPYMAPPPTYLPSLPQLPPITGPQQYSSPYAPKQAPAAPTPNPTQPGFNGTHQLPNQTPSNVGLPASDTPQQSTQQNQLQQPSLQKPVAQTNQPQPQNPQNPQHLQHTHNTPNTQTSQYPPPPSHQTSSQTPPLPPKSTLPPTSNKPPPKAILDAIETFKTNFMPIFASKSDNAQAVVASAVDQVLGYKEYSTVPGDPHELQILRALVSVLLKVHEFNPTPYLRRILEESISQSDTNSPQPQQQPQGQAQSPVQAQTQLQTQPDTQKFLGGPQANAPQQPLTSPVPADPTPVVTRPSFNGGNSRPGAFSIPRPPLKISSVARIKSESVPVTSRSNVPSSASPAPVPSHHNSPEASNGANTSTLSTNENRQIAGQKRPLEDAEEPEHKRLATALHPGASTSTFSTIENSQMAGQKRPLEDAEESVAKRLATTPRQVKA